MSPADKNNDAATVPQHKTPRKHSLCALRSPGAHLRLWVTMSIGLVADLTSKSWAVHTLGDPDTGQAERLIVIKDYLVFTTVYNTGAVAGIAAGKTTFLLMVSVVALIFLFWFFATTGSKQWFVHIALGLLFAGALGNMHDRIFNHGKVVDFIEVNLHFPGADPWPTFNIADSFLCVGVGVLLVWLLVGHKRSVK